MIYRMNRIQQRSFTEVRPRVLQDGDLVSLQFQNGEIQSAMLVSDPHLLTLPYTRTMAAFQLFFPEPERIAMIGLGGGSIAKWCYQQLPEANITVIEINPHVISLRAQFYIPEDDHRLSIIQGDGADYVAGTKDSPEVLLVDGFDVHGQPPQLCSEWFYKSCYRALATDSLLVVNLCGPDDQTALDHIREIFHNRVFIVTPEGGENKIVFAVKGRCCQIENEPADTLLKQFHADYMLAPALFQS